MNETDLELLGRYGRERSEEAFAELVRRHLDLVHSAALRQVRSPQLAEEVAQSAFIDLARNAHRLAPDTILTAWLYQVTRCTAIDVVRREARRQLREQIATEMNALNATDADWTHIEPFLDEAMSALDETDRAAVLLRYFENKSLCEVGQALGTSDDAAQKRVSRAVERLREFFAKRGVALGTGGLVIAISANAVQGAPVGLAASLVAGAMNAATATTTNLAAIKHALDLLALTKAKAAILAGLVALSVIGTALVLQPRQPNPGSRPQLPAGLGIADVRMGHSHGLVLAADGSLWSWGTNSFGWPVLGLGEIHKQATLRRIGDESDWIAIASSETHSLVLKADGSMWAWGENLYGQLGIGSPDSRKRRNTKRNTPTPSAPGNDWKQVAAGGSHSLALKQDGTLWAWGLNWAGQLGIGSTEKEVHEVTQVGTGTNWTRVWSCGIQSIGQQSDGSLWFWGSLTGSAQDTNRYRIPTRVSEATNWVDVGFGFFLVFAIKADGTLWAWGHNAGIYTGAPIALLNPEPAQVGSASGWLECSDSGRFYHLLKKKDGSLWALDATDYVYESKASHKPIEFRRVKVLGDVVAFATADSSLYPAGVVLTKAGEVWTWGRVFGEFTPGNPKWRSWTRSLGWKTDRFDSKPVVRDEPWLLPHEQ